MKTLVVNFYGGPGTGKSTMTNRVFSELKDLAYNVEIATEYAKDLTWEESHAVLDNQVYVFGKQQHRIWRLNNKVQIILTDSPLLFSLVYRKEKTSILFKYFVQDEFSRYNNMNIYLNRVKPYNPIGRNQTEDEAKQLDKEIYQLVSSTYKFDLEINGEKTSTDTVVKTIIEHYNKLQEDI
jgi:hypothetical protein